MSARMRRLQHEYEAMQELDAHSSLITFREYGSPPTRYDVILTCEGICLVLGKLQTIDKHRCTITLDERFPRISPTIHWETPVFHPNMSPPTVCLGNMWHASWTVATICETLCEMVQYKKFNIYDPLNPTAAVWLAKQIQKEDFVLPIDNRSVRDDFIIRIHRTKEG